MYVKDDHSYTRGPGAIAAMDAVSSRRRRAAARGARRMARRDAIMSRHTLGRIMQTDPGDGAGGSSGSGGRVAPPLPPVQPRPVIKLRGPGMMSLTTTATKPVVKAPGATLAPPRAHEPKSTFEAMPISVVLPAPVMPGAQVTPVLPPSKPPITIVTGGGGPWIPPKPTAPPLPPMDVPAFEPDAEVLPPASTPQSAKTSSNLLLYAAIGIGAWWLLTRE